MELKLRLQKKFRDERNQRDLETHKMKTLRETLKLRHLVSEKRLEDLYLEEMVLLKA